MGIASLFKSVQLPKFAYNYHLSLDLVGVAGSTLQTYHRSFCIYSLFELANNKFGFINSQQLYIHDLDTSDFIEKFQINTEVYLNYYRVSPHRNIFLAESNNLLIIQRLSYGKEQTYMADITSAIQIK